MCLSAIVGGASALIGAGSAKSAQKSQERAAQAQLDLQKEMYDETTQRFEPYYQGGLDYNNALRFELLGGDRPTFGGNALSVNEVVDPGKRVQVGVRGRGDEPVYEMQGGGTTYTVGGQSYDTREAADAYARQNSTGATEYRGFQATPGYQFALEQGQQSIDSSAASRGGLFSGATLKAQQQYGTGMANQEYGNYLNRLTGQASQGQAAAGNMANAGANYAAGAGQAYGNMGNAGAAGAIGVGNALQNGISNGIGLWNYQKQQTAMPQQNNALWGNGGLY